MLQQIPITISTDDDLLAAMLRLISAQGLTVTVDAIERPGVDEAERLLLSIELPTRATIADQAPAFAMAAGPVRVFDHDDDEAIDPFAAGKAAFCIRRGVPCDDSVCVNGGCRWPVGSSATATATGIELDLQPADDDAVYRPHSAAAAAAPADDKRDEIDKQLLIVSRLADRPGLGDVCRHLLRPLAGKGWHIDGDREAVLFRRAEEFGSYRPSMLKAAAEYLLRGKHSHFPDSGEIMKALGWAAAPGRTAHEAKAA